MSYYFPFASPVPTNVIHSRTAVSASLPVSSTVLAKTALYAEATQSKAADGQNGISKTFEECNIPSLFISGARGVQGPTGSQGSANTTCPAGSIECTGLNVSLSGAFPGYPNGINATLPTGSRYSKVCMEIPPGCTSGTAVCPDYLPLGSYPSIP